jgi:hypothetical protein
VLHKYIQYSPICTVFHFKCQVTKRFKNQKTAPIFFYISFLYLLYRISVRTGLLCNENKINYLKNYGKKNKIKLTNKLLAMQRLQLSLSSSMSRLNAERSKKEEKKLNRKNQSIEQNKAKLNFFNGQLNESQVYRRVA